MSFAVFRTNFLIFDCFWLKNKIPKKYCLKNRILKKSQQLFSNFIYIIHIVWILWFFFVCFVVCNVSGHFFLVIFMFFNIVKVCSPKRKAVFKLSISQLNKTSYQIKVHINPFKVWFGSKKSHNLLFLALKLNFLALNYVHMSSYFRNMYRRTVLKHSVV